MWREREAEESLDNNKDELGGLFTFLLLIRGMRVCEIKRERVNERRKEELCGEKNCPFVDIK